MDNVKNFKGMDLTIRKGRPEIIDPLVQQFFDYWVSLKTGDDIPCKSDIDPMEIPACLPYVWIYRYLEEEDNFICDLAGEDINQTWSKSLRGKLITELYDEAHSQMLHARWLYSLAHNSFLYGRDMNSGSKNASERLVFPIKDKHGHINTVFGISVYTYTGLRNVDETPEMVVANVALYDVNSLND